MLTDAEREVWDDIERRYAAEFQPSRRMDPSAVLVVGARIAIVLILLGAVAAGLVVGGATGLAGLLSGFSLIVAIGAQNAFVLRQGVARDHIGVVVAICALSDVVLIGAGVVGVGALVESHPTVLRIFTLGGAAYLVWFGVRSLLAARTPRTLVAGAPSA